MTVLSILIRKQEIMKNGQCLEPKVVLTCVGNSEMRRNGKVIDPILDEMFMIRFQPLSSLELGSRLEIGTTARRLETGDWGHLTLRFKNWDERLLNHIVDTPCMRYNLDNYRSVNHV